MGHYDDFEAANKYNAKLEKKYTKLIPQGNTSDLHTNTIDDALGFCQGSQPPVAVEGVVEQAFNKTKAKAKKQTKNKVEGARYCYLSSIASVSHYAGCAEDQLGKYLDKLLDHDFRGEGSTQHLFVMIEQYCAIAIGSHKLLWDGVVAVRANGLLSGKYTVGNHKLPMEKDLLLDAAARHLISYLFVNTIDAESGQNHLCHIMANILMFAAQLNIEKGE